MEGPTAVFLAMIIIGLPVLMLMLIANRYFRLREKKLEVEATLAAKKPHNMRPVQSNWSSACGSSSKSSPTAVRKRLPRSRRCVNRRAFLQGKRLDESLRVRPRDHRRHRHIFAPAPPDGRPAALGSAGRRRAGKSRECDAPAAGRQAPGSHSCSSASSPIAAPRLQRRSKRFVTTNASPRRNRPDGRRPAYGDLHRRDRDDRFIPDGSRESPGANTRLVVTKTRQR